MGKMGKMGVESLRRQAGASHFCQFVGQASRLSLDIAQALGSALRRFLLALGGIQAGFVCIAPG